MPNNLYLLRDEQSGEAVVVDPSLDSQAALETMRQWQKQGTRLVAIWNTHGHFDHVYDNALWKNEFDVPVLMHRADEFWIERLHEQALWFGMAAPQVVRPDAWLEDGQTLRVGQHCLQVLCTPGHSPGSVSFHYDGGENANGAAPFCLSGDVIFAGSVGRTDLPGCSFDVLQHSLRRLSHLPPQTRLLPGHGAALTLEHELRTNPFYQQIATQNDGINTDSLAVNSTPEI